MMLEILNYGFMQKAIIAGLVTAIMCPVLGIFIVVRRQSLIGDGLGHMAFAGVTGGYLLGGYKIAGAFTLTILAAIGIELARRKNADYADRGLAIFFYAGIALAIVFSTIARMPSSNLLGVLFGSILTVSWLDVAVIGICALAVLIFIYIYFDRLVLLSFNEDIAKVSGINTGRLNMVLGVITAIVVVAGMPVVGILLISALMVVPVAAAEQLKKGFKATMFLAVIIAMVSVFGGLLISFYADSAPGGSIVLCTIGIYVACLLVDKIRT